LSTVTIVIILTKQPYTRGVEEACQGVLHPLGNIGYRAGFYIDRQTRGTYHESRARPTHPYITSTLGIMDDDCQTRYTYVRAVISVLRIIVKRRKKKRQQ